MKIRFLKESALEILKENVKVNLEYYKNDDNNWIYDFFEEEEPFLEFRSEVDEFDLYMSEINPRDTDFENIKRVYTNLMFLSDSQASDERLWAGLAHDKFWGYMRYRWGNEPGIGEEWNKKYQRYFYKNGKRRSSVFNGIGRLWWIGRLTYDSSFEDPFEITKYMMTDLSTKCLYLISSSFVSNDIVRLGMFKGILEIEKNGYSVKRSQLNKLIIKLNLFGGVYLLDCYTEDEIKEKSISLLIQIFKEEAEERNLKQIQVANKRLSEKKQIILNQLQDSKVNMKGKQSEVMDYIINNLDTIDEFSNSQKLGNKLGVSAKVIDAILIKAKMGSYSSFIGKVKKII